MDINKIDFVDDSTLAWIYSRNKYTLYLSTREPFGLVPVEAIKFGSIPIVIDNAGPSESVNNNDDGYKVKINDVIGSTVKILKNDTPTYQKPSYILDICSSKNMVDELVKVITNYYIE